MPPQPHQEAPRRAHGDGDGRPGHSQHADSDRRGPGPVHGAGSSARELPGPGHRALLLGSDSRPGPGGPGCPCPQSPGTVTSQCGIALPARTRGSRRSRSLQTRSPSLVRGRQLGARGPGPETRSASATPTPSLSLSVPIRKAGMTSSTLGSLRRSSATQPCPRSPRRKPCGVLGGVLSARPRYLIRRSFFHLHK